MDDGDGAAGGHRSHWSKAARKSEVARELRGLPPLGDHPGAAVPRRGRAGLAPRSRRPHAQSRPHRRRRSRTRSSSCARTSTGGGHEAGAATIAAHLEQRHGPDACRRCRRSGGSCPPADSSPRNRTNARNPATGGSARTPRTSAGNSTSPTTASPKDRGRGARHRRHQVVVGGVPVRVLDRQLGLAHPAQARRAPALPAPASPARSRRRSSASMPSRPVNQGFRGGTRHTRRPGCRRTPAARRGAGSRRGNGGGPVGRRPRQLAAQPGGQRRPLPARPGPERPGGRRAGAG